MSEMASFERDEINLFLYDQPQSVCYLRDNNNKKTDSRRQQLSNLATNIIKKRCISIVFLANIRFID